MSPVEPTLGNVVPTKLGEPDVELATGIKAAGSEVGDSVELTVGGSVPAGGSARPDVGENVIAEVGGVGFAVTCTCSIVVGDCVEAEVGGVGPDVRCTGSDVGDPAVVGTGFVTFCTGSAVGARDRVGLCVSLGDVPAISGAGVDLVGTEKYDVQVAKAVNSPVTTRAKSCGPSGTLKPRTVSL